VPLLACPAVSFNSVKTFAPVGRGERSEPHRSRSYNRSKDVDVKDTLKVGLTHEFRFSMPESKIVSALFPESPAFQLMPRVLATGFMVGLIEWTCIQAVNPHLDWPREQTVGIGINVSHTAATPVGLTVTVNVRLEKVEGRKLTFSVRADDGVDEISTGIRERSVIDAAKFNGKMTKKVGQESAR
jgi:fluoroacetyl-CoA thioesterase